MCEVISLGTIIVSYGLSTKHIIIYELVYNNMMICGSLRAVSPLKHPQHFKSNLFVIGTFYLACLARDCEFDLFSHDSMSQASRLMIMAERNVPAGGGASQHAAALLPIVYADLA